MGRRQTRDGSAPNGRALATSPPGRDEGFTSTSQGGEAPAQGRLRQGAAPVTEDRAVGRITKEADTKGQGALPPLGQ